MQQTDCEMHIFYMQQTLDYIEQLNLSYISYPNPHVACCIVYQQQIIAYGCSQQAGHKHAEIVAINHLKAHYPSINPKECTMYVTLEPCAHFGRTGPCSHAIVNAGIGRVIILLKDPFKQVNGKGFDYLKSHHIDVNYLEDYLPSIDNQNLKQNIETLKQQASYIMRSFLYAQQKQTMPWLRVKLACSLDSMMCLENNESKWLTGQLARNHNQTLRARGGAVISTAKTILADNAQMNVRLEHFNRPIVKVVLDKHSDFLNLFNKNLNISETIKFCQAKINLFDETQKNNINTNQSIQSIKHIEEIIDIQIKQNLDSLQDYIICFHQNRNFSQNYGKIAFLQGNSSQLSIYFIELDTINIAADNLTFFKQSMQALHTLNILEVHIEAGPNLTSYLLQNQQFNELAIYQAPILLGQGKTWLNQPTPILQKINHGQNLKLAKHLQLEQDIYLSYLKSS